MFASILVPFDFSPASDAALAHARTLAATFGGRLHLLHVLPNTFLRAMVNDPRDVEAAMVDQLRDRVPDADPSGPRPVAVVVRSDNPADEIVSYARTQDIDVIVMGTHSRHGLARALIGSVAEQVVRTAPCPVLTVPDAAGLHEAEKFWSTARKFPATVAR
jgi:nucleotide-binding universal stress UspA family protein